LAKTSRKCALHPAPPLDVRCNCHVSVCARDPCDSGSGSATHAPARAPFIRFFLLACVAAVTFRCTLLTALIRGSEAAAVHLPRHTRYVRISSDARCISVDFEQKCSAPPPSPCGSNARRDCNGSGAAVRDPVWRGLASRAGCNLCPIGLRGSHHPGFAGVDSEMDGRCGTDLARHRSGDAPSDRLVAGGWLCDGCRDLWVI
jgi:hypothetical protein